MGRYDQTLTWVLDRQAITLAIALATLVVTVLLFLLHPQGPVPDPGHRPGAGRHPGQPDHPPIRRWPPRSNRWRPPAEGPRRRRLTSFIGVDGQNTTLNTGRMLISLAPFGKRTASLPAHPERLRRDADPVAGVSLYVQPVQDLTIDSSSGRTQYQFALQGADTATVAEWSGELVKALAKEPKIRNVGSDLQNRGSGGLYRHRPGQRRAPGHHPGLGRRHAHTTPSGQRSSRRSSPNPARSG